MRGDFLDELLSGRYENENAVIAKAGQLGYDLRKTFQVVILAPDGQGSPVVPSSSSATGSVGATRTLYDLAREVFARRGIEAVVTIRDETVVLLVPVEGEQRAESTIALARSLVADIGRGVADITVSAGMGRICTALGDYAISYREGLECLRILRRLDQHGQVLCFSQLGVLSLLFKIEDRRELIRFVEETVGQLRCYDQRHGSEFLKTIHAYLDNNCNLRATAKALHVHVNTLSYRLQRFSSICSADLDDSGTRLAFQVALKIMDMIADPQSN